MVITDSIVCRLSQSAQRATTNDTKQAIALLQFGSPESLEFTESEIPVFGDNDVLVRVHAASVCKSDVNLQTGGNPTLYNGWATDLLRSKNRVPGQDLAGRVAAVGANVLELREGDEVYGRVPSRAFALYAAAPSDEFTQKPQNLTFEQSAAVPDSGLTALQGLRDIASLKTGHTVLNQRRLRWRWHVCRSDCQSSGGRGDSDL